MQKDLRFKEVDTIFNCLINSSFIKDKEDFPNIIVTELLYSIRFKIQPTILCYMFYDLIRFGYNPFSFNKNSKEYIQVRNIIKIIDHAEE